MINYFFYPKSFKDVAIEEIVALLNDLNVAMLESDSEVEHFYADGVLYSLNNTDGSNVYQKLCESEKQFAIRVLPSIARRFKSINNDIICDDVNLLKSQFPLICSLWGVFNDVKDMYHTCCLEDYRENRKLLAKEINSADNFAVLQPILLNNLQFSSDALSQVVALGDKRIINLCMVFGKVNEYCSMQMKNNFRMKMLRDSYSVDISDESDNVKQQDKLKSQRHFYVSNAIGWQYCFVHIKVGNLRIYIHPDNEKNIIHVVYVGQHLSTQKYK